ncbi:MAG: carboxypeptidase [Aeriscardovia sp.]|nr:carboxypeptidase [Aeriscardovia sp.]
MMSDTEKNSSPTEKKDPTIITPEDLPQDSSHRTRHTWSYNGKTIDYDAIVGTLRINTPKVKPAASIFYSMFVAVDADGNNDPTRPVTFVFNGGPGSSSTFLMMGSFGPKRISIPDLAPGEGAPYTLIENNEYCLLPVSDIVFIDAAGAGFSQIADKAKAELWSVDGDVAGFSQFIQRWCTKYGRWNSPKYLFGESYGTTRGSLLTLKMEQDGISLTGATLISNILDYAYTFDLNDQYYIGYMPTYAMISQFHHKAGQEKTIKEHAMDARVFAEEYRKALSRGDALDSESKERVAQAYAQLTGLPATYIEDSNLRVPDGRYRKQILRKEEKIVGRYDGRVSGYDMDPISDDETFIVDDAYLSPEYGALANEYLRKELGWETDEERIAFAPFDWTTTEPGKGWVWTHKTPYHMKADEWGYMPFPNTLGDLANAIVQEPKLKVLIGNGYYDLATPFFQTEYDIDHLALPQALRKNIALTYYESGHMIYTAPQALDKLYNDLVKFYTTDADHMSELDERENLPSLQLNL